MTDIEEERITIMIDEEERMIEIKEAVQMLSITIEIDERLEENMQTLYQNKEEEERRSKLYVAAMKGDWNTAKEIFEKYPERKTERLNIRGETPLHVAVAARRSGFVEKLVEILEKEDLEIRTISKKHKLRSDEDGSVGSNSDTELGNTAFCCAAMHGFMDGIDIMMKKKPDLINIRDVDGRLPVCTSSLNGHWGIAYRLYYHYKGGDKMEHSDLFQLALTLIKIESYDFALLLLREHPWLATSIYNETHKERTIVYALAQHPCSTQCSYRKIENYRKLLSFTWDQLITRLDYGVIDSLSDAMFVAAKQENLEFLTSLPHSFSHFYFLTEVNENNHTIFHTAVLSRFRMVFDLIDEFGLTKNSINRNVDANGNNMLHLAGYLPSSSSPKFKIIEYVDGQRKQSFDGYPPLLNRLNHIPGAALQLQSELVWFEEVKKIMEPQQINAKNNDELTPGDMFLKEHEDLRKSGEEWMRNTATSCMVVAALIATVVFAATFTVPGGTGQDGVPIFLAHPAFKVFAMADAISLVFSISTVLSFLSILTSRYSTHDFRYSLPIKLILGLFFLFISVMAMMIAFVAAFFIIIFKHKQLRFAHPIAAVAFIPICMFVLQHTRLFYQVIHSTFFSSLPLRTKKEKPSLWTRIKSKIMKKFN